MTTQATPAEATRVSSTTPAAATPLCQLCGQPGRLSALDMAGRPTVALCGRCRPSFNAALAERMADETVGGDGLSRRQAASALVARLCEV
jgi:hypothetical protein